MIPHSIEAVSYNVVQLFISRLTLAFPRQYSVMTVIYYVIIIPRGVMMKKVLAFIVLLMLTAVLSGCESRTNTTTETVDTFSYESLTLPDYTTMNPVRYLDEGELGPYNGWQDFGTNGEILTIAVPIMSTYSYQMYAYYIRNDLQALYGDVILPDNVSDLAEWITDVNQNGHRILWYSMGGRLPDSIELVNTMTIISDNGLQSFLEVEFQITLDDISEQWIVYIMESNGVFSSYGVKVNEYFEFVQPNTETIIKTYQVKS